MAYSWRRVKNRFDLWKRKHLHASKIVTVLLLVLFLAIFLPVILYLLIHGSYAGRMYRNPDDVPPGLQAIVLGATVEEGIASDALKERIQASVDLYKTGAVKGLIMSGNSEAALGDEAAEMYDRAVDLGVPVSDLQVDAHSTKTYDTCYRARYVYELREVILVSQEMHLTRALYICNSLGVKARGYVAEVEDIAYQEDFIHEVLGLVQAVWEVNVGKPEVSEM